MGSDQEIPCGVTIRPFTGTPEDYAACVHVMNTVWPEYPETVEEMRRSDDDKDPKLLWGRFLAEDAGSGVVGLGRYGQSSGMYHPRKFIVEVMVLPCREGRGIGSALYERVREAIAPYDPISLRSTTREDQERGRGFLERRGYRETMREHESRIDLATFDPSAFAEDLERAASHGITIRTTRELRETDPDFLHKTYELHWAVGQDIPHPEPPTKPPYEEFLKRYENPNYLWDGNYIALDGDRYVGVSVLWAAKATTDLFTGTTGVLRDYRKKGIATALKVRALTWAKEERCAPGVRTWNEVGNVGMLGINFRLGFVRRPSWIDYGLTLKEENEQI